ncbi:helix-turn-helix transcriptional regulator [Methylocapsa sp. S129]|uniref:ArsR/SmtB family transcription factor n=1 Tax=Methylocapsa sp. S129 TaxID=1641869 RepID=UPI00131DB492|nr:helix-turn-helix domain-containing protein [Methylocapsa sp. S129]
MSRPRIRAELEARASVFAALGDETRLLLVGKLSNGLPQSISRLAEGSALTRQAIAKHLRVLERAGLVRGMRAGRESRFAFTPEPFKEAQSYLERVSSQWDDVLARLKFFVEDEES